MNIESSLLRSDEKTVFKLRSLYKKFGYTQFKMSKFEEYELYVQNKNFLISDHIITFTENGRLMALKPDVTLSIIKNIKDRSEGVQKLFYNENVYRISKGNQSYKEIMQVGLECIGDIGMEDIRQVIILAAKSLQSISGNCVLNVTNLDLLSQVIAQAERSGVKAADILKCVEEKNEAGLKKLDIPENILTVLSCLIRASGSAEQVLPELIKIRIT